MDCGEQPGEPSFGFSVASAGDVNGDGFGDVIVGAPYYDGSLSDEGRAFTYHGGSTGLTSFVPWLRSGGQVSASFGYSVASAGDVDDDGFGDVIVGAPFHDNGQTNEGRAYVTLGDASGLVPSPDFTLEVNQAEANLGFSLASAGDVDGDGFSDVIAGAFQHDNGQSNEGRAIALQTFVACAPIDIDEVFETINDDLSGADVDDQPYFRYLTLSNRSNPLGCGPGLERERKALVKLINSLSLDADIEAPVPLGSDRFVYRIDLRDYQWDRGIEVNGQSFDDVWEAIVAHNPYAVRFVGDAADDAVDDSGTQVPFMHADSLLAAAAVDELYYAIIDIDVNQTLDDFIANGLGIDVEADLQDAELVRAGFSGTRLGLPNLGILSERHNIEVRGGYLWQIAEFGGDLEFLQRHPLDQPQGEREVLFTLPNGLYAYALAGGDGQLLAVANVFRDLEQPNLRHRIAVSSFAQFARGVDVIDQVRVYALDHAREIGLSRDDVELLEAIYPQPGPLAVLLATDRAQQAALLAPLGVNIGDPDPISIGFSAFNAGVDLATAAGDLHVTSEELEDNLDLLDPTVAAGLDNGGTLSRNVWTLHYLESLCIISTNLENPPDFQLCD